MTIDPSRPASGPNDNLRGTLLMLAGFGAFSCADIAAKILTANYHPVQIVWTRQLGVTIGVIALILINGVSILKSQAPRLQIARGLCAIASALFFVFAIAYVPLADAVAVSFVAPFIVTILGAVLLGEAVGLRRWAAVFTGFLGTLIVVRPGLGVFHPAIFLVLGAATVFAARQIISRFLGRRDPTATTLAYTSMTTVAVLILPLPFIWEAPKSAGDVALMTGMALAGGLGEYLIIRALEIAHAVVVAPMQYSLIVYSTLWGFLVFGHLPDLWTWVGAFVIIASGLYTLYRETLHRRRSMG